MTVIKVRPCRLIEIDAYAAINSSLGPESTLAPLSGGGHQWNPHALPYKKPGENITLITPHGVNTACL